MDKGPRPVALMSFETHPGGNSEAGGEGYEGKDIGWGAERGEKRRNRRERRGEEMRRNSVQECPWNTAVSPPLAVSHQEDSPEQLWSPHPLSTPSSSLL